MYIAIKNTEHYLKCTRPQNSYCSLGINAQFRYKVIRNYINLCSLTHIEYNCDFVLQNKTYPYKQTL